jgi:hypothetical protein
MSTTDLARKLAQWLALPSALFALACALFAPAPAAPSRARARQEPQVAPVQMREESGSTVRGRVVYEETTRPVRRARLTLVNEAGTRTDYNALTDARGDFRIANVRAGSYLAFVDVPGVLSPVGFVSVNELRTGQPDFTEARPFFDRIEVDGKQDVQVTVHARRGAAVSGKVTYADGDPAVSVVVNVMRRGADGRLMRYLTGANLVSISGLKTDDRGMFRVTGLPPGEYVIAVAEPVAHGSPDGRGRGDDISGMVEGLMGQQLLMTFYPSALSAKEATVLKLAAGDERPDVDINIPERELRTVAGVVRSRRDKTPVARARVSIVRRDDPVGAVANVETMYATGDFMPNSTTTDADGRWEFREIPDGPYTVVVKPPEEYESVAAEAVMMNSNMSSAVNMNGPSPGQRRRKNAYAPTRRDFEVSADLSDVAVEVGDGARISGTITVEGGRAPHYGYVNAVRAPEGGGAPAPSDAYNATAYGGRFAVEGLPAGRFYLQPSTYDDGERLYVKSVTRGGRDLLREPLALAEGENADDVEIVFSRNPATLRVTATAAATGKPAPGAFVMVVPADLSAWAPYTQPLYCLTEDGFCTVSAPPGDYRVVGLPNASARGTLDGEIRRRAATAPRVSLRAGETKEFALTMPDK